MSSNGHILRPGQQVVNVQHHAEPHAYPSTMLVTKETGKDLHIFGGLTKLEAGALQIAGMMVIGGVEPAKIPAMAADLATCVLAECERRQAEFDSALKG